jgi:glycosyltransferase involved in cell wall biosynthesis
MKIIYCIHSTSNSGGMERVLSNKVNYLAKLENYEVLIITTDQQGKPHFYDIPSQVKCIDLGINYSHTVNEGILSKTFKSIIKYRSHKKRLKKILFEVKADVVISMFNNDVSFLYKINDGSKKVVEIHFCREFRLLAERKGILRLLDIYKTYVNDQIVEKYDSFVVLTYEDKKNWKASENIKVIYNALPSKAVKVSTLSNKNIISIGRYSYQKNFELLIDIWKQLSVKHPDWNLTIIGSGDFSQISARINKYSLYDTVKILPATDSIEDFYFESSIYMMTSRYEGLPMVLVESQKFGIPIVSVDCNCGPKEIINDGVDGFLIEKGNTNDFVNKVSLLMENEKLRKSFGESAKINSLKFSEEKIMQQWISLFEEITKKPSC